MRITYIYTLEHPITNEIRYVGKTLNITKRRNFHCNLNIQSKYKSHVSRWIISLYNQGLVPNMIIIDQIKGDWRWLEQYWIEQFKIWGCNLTNHTIGGEGTSGWVPSDEFKKKQTLLKKGRVVPQNVIEAFRKRIKGNTFTRGEQNPRSKLKETDVILICELLNKGVRSVDIAKQISNCTPNIVGLIKMGKTWKHLTKNLIRSNSTHPIT
jgi:hypothetical protein